MKNIEKIILLIALFVSFAAVNSFAKDVAFSQDDRDRLIRVEEGFRAVNQRIDDLNQSLSRRIDDVMNLLYVVIAGMIGFIGFVIWDRRTAITPVTRRTNELEEREERLEKALREYAKKEPGLAEVLRNFGLM